MWSLGHGVSDVILEHSLEVPTTVDQDVVKALSAHGPNRTAPRMSFARGERIGVRMTRRPAGTERGCRAPIRRRVGMLGHLSLRSQVEANPTRNPG